MWCWNELFPEPAIVSRWTNVSQNSTVHIAFRGRGSRLQNETAASSWVQTTKLSANPDLLAGCSLSLPPAHLQASIFHFQHLVFKGWKQHHSEFKFHTCGAYQMQHNAALILLTAEWVTVSSHKEGKEQHVYICDKGGNCVAFLLRKNSLPRSLVSMNGSIKSLFDQSLFSACVSHLKLILFLQHKLNFYLMWSCFI